MLVRTVEDVDRYLGQVRKAAADAHAWIAGQTGDPLDPLDLLRRMKFETIGFHPIENHALNIIEQINQTWTYTVALAAARQLLELDLKKMAARSEQHHYIFFMSPRFPGARRLTQFERDGVQVWSVDV